MRFKTEIEVVTLDEHDQTVATLSRQVEEARARVLELENAAHDQTDWKKQCEDLLARQDGFQEELRVCRVNLDAVRHQRDEALERVVTQAAALKKAAELNLELKEEVEAQRGASIDDADRERTPAGPGRPRYPGEY